MPGGVQLSDDGDIQPLLRERISMFPRRNDAGMAASKSGCVKNPRAKANGSHRRLVRPFATLHAGDALDSEIGQRGGAEDQAAAGCLFEGDARLHDLRVFFERAGERGIKGDGVALVADEKRTKR